MKEYIENYFNELSEAEKKISWQEIARALQILHTSYENDGRVYLIGNGGSAAIVSHFANDLNKTVFGYKGEKKMKRFQAISLTENTSALTSWANDVGYEFVFAEQLNNFAQEKDVLFAISSSGNSANIIKAVETAKKKNMSVIGLVGFTGGKLMPLSDAKVYVPSQKYMIVESAHDAICHLIVTYFEELL